MRSNLETKRRDFIHLAGSMLLGTLHPDFAFAGNARKPDICIYCTTASGIMAAVAATKECARGVIVEASRWLPALPT